ncbi:MAG TPA: 30S ribosomal protein S8, partial [Opitutales bacterium]|nr:30S ribosomal protein S8 [Opitutales bacterium]
MAVHDTIGDFLTTIRNASAAHKEVCTVQSSKMRSAIAAILKDEGYISEVSEGENEKGFKTLTLSLKFV